MLNHCKSNSHLLPIDVAVLDEGGAADVDGDVLRGLPVLDEALLHVVLLTLLLLQQKKHQIKPISHNQGMYLEKKWMKYEMSPPHLLRTGKIPP